MANDENKMTNEIQNPKSKIQNATSARDAILSRIRGVLAGDSPQAIPPVSEVWPRLNPTVDEMVQQFSAAIEAVAGQMIRCPSIEAARIKLAELLDQSQAKSLAAMDRSLCRELTTGLDAGQVAWAVDAWTPQTLSDVPVGLVEADCLLADTGTAMVACGTAAERWLCYLPPTSIIVASVDRLVEHLPAAWEQIGRRAADPQLRGEFVFITGPSRTSDIEKILILGVHGPHRLVVLVVG
jgi:L-lactate dehydrogenase complex protein LldG